MNFGVELQQNFQLFLRWFWADFCQLYHVCVGGRGIVGIISYKIKISSLIALKMLYIFQYI